MRAMISRNHRAFPARVVCPVSIDTRRIPSIPVGGASRNPAARVFRDDASRRGVALLIVLGMLALLMILGVAFSITMRTERMSANYYVHQIRAQYLGHVALAQAVAELNSNLHGRVYPDWDLDMLFSSGATNGGGFLSEALKPHLPAFDWNRFRGEVEDNIRWTAQPDSRGRYAYVVLNTSGLLDANYAGGGDRHYGIDASEIDLNVDASFFQTRADHVRFETLAEIAHASEENNWTQPDTINIRPPVPLGRLEPDGAASHEFERINLSAAELVQNREEIVAAFEKAGIDNTTELPHIGLTPAEVAFYNLVDYVDDDDIPANLDGTEVPDPRIPSVERVPMFNAFEIEYTVERDTADEGEAANYTVEGHVRFELAWLFEDAATSSYTHHHRVVFTSDTGNDDYAADSLTPASMTFTPSRFYTAEYDLSGAGQSDDGNFEITAAVTSWIKNSNGDVVDTNRTLTVSRSFNVAEGQSVTHRWGMECIDPRMNWFEFIDEAEQIPNWVETDSPNIGSMNAAAENKIDEEESDAVGNDGEPRYFVANRELETVGELGYLFYGEPMQTIRLFRHLVSEDPIVLSQRQHHVLDYFTIHENLWQDGLINPNTDILDVLVDAFLGMPYGAGPDDDSSTVSGDDAESIAEAWIRDLENLAPNVVTNLSDIGRFANVFHDNDWATGLSEHEKEALIRNAAHLFHPRQNHFTIVIAVNTFGVTGQHIGTRRFVAEVWRDPFRHPDDPENAPHRVYLRSWQRAD